MVHLDATFTRNVSATWGDAGARWLATLPAVVAGVERDWAIRIGEPFSGLTFHWVARATLADGSSAVLKLGLPFNPHMVDEAAALDAFAGSGAVRLLRFDEALGAVLLERASPGTTAADLVAHHDEDATAAAIGVLQRLHASPGGQGSLRPLIGQRDALIRYLADPGQDQSVPGHLVVQAAELFTRMVETAEKKVVLHGDLHHDNIVRATRDPWLAIDPHGVFGDRGYDVGSLLYNPDIAARDPQLLSLVPRRIDQLVEGLALPRERVVAWGFVKAVLSEVWTAQGGGTGATRALDVAKLLLPELQTSRR